MLFILVMELISRKIMYADDLVIDAEHREELQGGLEKWNEMFKKHGLKKDEPRQDRSDVGWETQRGAKHQVGRERHYASKEFEEASRKCS